MERIKTELYNSGHSKLFSLLHVLNIMAILCFMSNSLSRSKHDLEVKCRAPFNVYSSICNICKNKRRYKNI